MMQIVKLLFHPVDLVLLLFYVSKKNEIENIKVDKYKSVVCNLPSKLVIHLKR